MSSTFQRLNPHQARLVALLKRALPLRSRDAFRALHPQPQRLMALDVGDAFVGMAMSDKWQRVALPFKDGQLRRDLVSTVENRIRDVVVQKNVEAAVVGYPMFNGLEGVQCLHTLEFLYEVMRPPVSLPITSVYLCDELFTTQQAKRNLDAMNISEKNRRDHLDHEAAVLILQDYIDYVVFASNEKRFVELFDEKKPVDPNKRGSKFYKKQKGLRINESVQQHAERLAQAQAQSQQEAEVIDQQQVDQHQTEMGTADTPVEKAAEL